MSVTEGSLVRVHYRGTFDDGAEFDSSAGRDPLEFSLGAGQVIPGFDAAVAALEIGGTTTVTIPAEEAYGEHSLNWSR
jgi:peptidylprolyl isomerase